MHKNYDNKNREGLSESLSYDPSRRGFQFSDENFPNFLAL